MDCKIWQKKKLIYGFWSQIWSIQVTTETSHQTTVSSVKLITLSKSTPGIWLTYCFFFNVSSVIAMFVAASCILWWLQQDGNGTLNGNLFAYGNREAVDSTK